MSAWTNEFFFIAAPRKDGTAPKLEKAVDGKLYLEKGEAITVCDELSEANLYAYGVFPATAEILRQPPVHRSNVKDRLDAVANLTAALEIDDMGMGDGKLATSKIVAYLQNHPEFTVFLNGKPANIKGYKNQFGTVAQIDGPVSHEWSWWGIANIIVKQQGRFTSNSPSRRH